MKRDDRGAWSLLAIWATIGLQSFGGGASTLLLIRRAFVEKRDWVEVEEFAHFWNLCQFTPGINLLALTILIGRKLAGARGIVASLAGLLVPSAIATCLLAAGFQSIHHSSAVHDILRGVLPATAGVMASVGLDFMRPPLKRARRDGVKAVLLSMILVLGCALSIILLKLSVAVALAGVAALSAGIFTPWRARTPVVAGVDLSREGESS